METNWNHLPTHLQDHIRTYIPLTCMSVDLQQDIRTQSALLKINKMDNLWCSEDKFYEWEDMSLTELGDATQTIENLSKCGCCERHSGFKRKSKIGTKFFNATSLNCDRDCKCPCRHWIRNFNRNLSML